MKKEGFKKFGMHQHTLLWKALDAKKKEKGFGGVAVKGVWPSCNRSQTRRPTAPPICVSLKR
jgi:hypothetical protein